VSSPATMTAATIQQTANEIQNSPRAVRITRSQRDGRSTFVNEDMRGT